VDHGTAATPGEAWTGATHPPRESWRNQYRKNARMPRKPCTPKVPRTRAAHEAGGSRGRAGRGERGAGGGVAGPKRGQLLWTAGRGGQLPALHARRCACRRVLLARRCACWRVLVAPSSARPAASGSRGHAAASRGPHGGVRWSRRSGTAGARWSAPLYHAKRHPVTPRRRTRVTRARQPLQRRLELTRPARRTYRSHLEPKKLAVPACSPIRAALAQRMVCCPEYEASTLSTSMPRVDGNSRKSKRDSCNCKYRFIFNRRYPPAEPLGVSFRPRSRTVHGLLLGIWNDTCTSH